MNSLESFNTLESRTALIILLYYFIKTYYIADRRQQGPIILSITHKWAPPSPGPIAPHSTAGAPHIAPKCTVQCSPQHCSGNGDLLAGGGGKYYFEKLVYCINIYSPPAIVACVYDRTKYKANIVRDHKACHYMS